MIAPRLRKRAQGVLVQVLLAGEWDCAVVDSLDAALRQCVDAGQTIEVDLTACTFCDVTTLGALVRAQREARARGHSLELVVPAKGTVTRRIFEATGTLSAIPWREAEGARAFQGAITHLGSAS